MLAIVVSRADSASVHVGEHLLDLGEWSEHTDSTRLDADGGGTVYRTADAELREFDDLHLEIENVGAAFGRVDEGNAADRTPDLLVFASRHAGETGPLLTAHHTGNFGPAEFGGTDGVLAWACPGAQKRVLDALREHAPLAYDVGLEATHHGPSSVGVPSMFVELGSGEAQWSDPDGARAVAKAILDLQGVAPDLPPEQRENSEQHENHEQRENPEQSENPEQREDPEQSENTELVREGGPPHRRHLVGFGGGHYAPRFERLVRETDWAVGHVAADWALADMGDPAENREVLRSAFEQSAATRAVVEGDASDVEAVVTDLGYRVVSETWVRETDGVPLPLVAALEDALCPVDEGMRFGERERETGASEAISADDVSIVPLPGDLLAEAQGIDADAVHSAVADATLAFETVENGTRAAGRAAVSEPDDRTQLVDALVSVLEERYEAVERRADEVVAREQAFDPDRARTLGIPEGPKFGRLSGGQPVEVDGRTIRPETVQVEREHRFSLGRAGGDGDD